MRERESERKKERKKERKEERKRERKKEEKKRRETYRERNSPQVFSHSSNTFFLPIPNHKGKIEWTIDQREKTRKRKPDQKMEWIWNDGMKWNDQ